MNRSAIKIISEFAQYCEDNNKTFNNQDLIIMCKKCEELFAQQIAMAFDAGLERGVRESDIMVTDEPLPEYGKTYYKEKYGI